MHYFNLLFLQMQQIQVQDYLWRVKCVFSTHEGRATVFAFLYAFAVNINHIIKTEKNVGFFLVFCDFVVLVFVRFF